VDRPSHGPSGPRRDRLENTRAAAPPCAGCVSRVLPPSQRPNRGVAAATTPVPPCCHGRRCRARGPRDADGARQRGDVRGRPGGVAGPHDDRRLGHLVRERHAADATDQRARRPAATPDVAGRVTPPPDRVGEDRAGRPAAGGSRAHAPESAGASGRRRRPGPVEHRRTQSARVSWSWRRGGRVRADLRRRCALQRHDDRRWPRGRPVPAWGPPRRAGARTTGRAVRVAARGHRPGMGAVRRSGRLRRVRRHRAQQPLDRRGAARGRRARRRREPPGPGWRCTRSWSTTSTTPSTSANDAPVGLPGPARSPARSP
jgi:hypothetical protein